MPTLHTVLLTHTGNRGLTKQLDQPAGIRSEGLKLSSQDIAIDWIQVEKPRIGA